MINPKLHTTEHIMWQVFKSKLNQFRSKSLQFTDQYCRFDFFTKQELSQKNLEELTRLVDGVINQHLEIVTEMISRKNAQGITDLSLIPKSIDSVRIVRIGNFSIEACAGEHVKNTSEIGEFQIVEFKKIGKDTFRIKFTLDNLN